MVDSRIPGQSLLLFEDPFSLNVFVINHTLFKKTGFVPGCQRARLHETVTTELPN